MLELYHHSESVCSQKVRLALVEKGVAEWTSHYVALEKGEQRTPEFRKINPKEIVPVLIHDGKNIPESTVICEYIDEVFDGPVLMPEDAYWRSRKRLWSKTVDEGLHYPNTFLISFIISFRHRVLADVDTPEKVEAHLGNIQNPKVREVHKQVLAQGLESTIFKDAIIFYDSVLENMEKTLKDFSWLAGDNFSLADIALAPYIHRLANLKMLFMCEKRPAILDWYARLQKRDSWQTAILDWSEQSYLSSMHSHGEQAKTKVEEIWRESV